MVVVEQPDAPPLLDLGLFSSRQPVQCPIPGMMLVPPSCSMEKLFIFVFYLVLLSSFCV